MHHAEITLPLGAARQALVQLVNDDTT